jgi:serine protease AprX
LTAAGNAGHDADPLTFSIIAPADAFNVITCGAANLNDSIAGFSSDGPTADGRLKPEVLACGVSVVSVNSTNPTGLSAVSGTSLSTPLIAGATALLMQARGDLGVAGVRDALFTTSSDFVANGFTDPLFVRGYGIISAIAAAKKNRLPADLNLDGLVNAVDLTALLAAWGLCIDPDPANGTCIADIDLDGSIGGSDIVRILSAWGQ